MLASGPGVISDLDYSFMSGNELLSCSRNRHCKLWDVSQPDLPPMELKTPSTLVSSVRFLPNASGIVTASHVPRGYQLLLGTGRTSANLTVASGVAA